MKREPFDPVKEREVIGMYPSVDSVELAGMIGIPPFPRMYRPIERRENFKMLFRGERPYWIPVCGWFGADTNMFRPRQQADNYANHQAFDGGERIDYRKLGNVLVGWFDIELQWEEKVCGATAKPGVTKIPDINYWEDYVSMPDLDQMDWKAIENDNTEYLAGDRIIQLGIQLGFWERLMNLMGVAEAAVALVDEDQQDGVHRFFDQLADVYVDYIRRMKKIINVESVFFHDDWGTSTGPFFSLDTCREMIVPYMKRVTDCCHELGIIFEHHCCGKAEKLIPAMIEEGDDYWYPQPSLNNVDAMIETYKEQPITFAVASPVMTSDMSDDTIRKMAQAWFEKYKDKGILLTMNIDAIAENDPSKYPLFEDTIYELSRIAYQDAE
ncbi:MAG: uroporphyrinogen decarboxylase [Eubacteriaceae bacterium]|jgi:hypothetical protein|nr:uroporphyrinogen decarboxylase [Eubacteriaceae bacterium]MDK2935026.1 uroporphyrinogen decarboxylase [Eubacteriaceae bacterium]MDK2961709.1 uroporphyrinogen decarboxylase [Eubacteriaceae bacterium]MDN5307128.1 uroporphyrinogen decarboxylase [Eubacteriaceae bacterium]